MHDDLTQLEEELAPSMARYVAPRPTAEETHALLAHLRPMVKARAAVAMAVPIEEPARTEDEWLLDQPSPNEDRGVRGWIQLARAQTPLLEPPFLWASALLFALGLLSAIIESLRPISLGVALLSPVIAAAGVAYAFRPSVRSLWEVERACPTNPIELVYARLGLVLSFNLGLSLLLLLLLSAFEPGLILWRFLIVWSGFMLGLAGLALFATVRWGALVGGAAPLLLWAALLALRYQTAGQEGLGALLNGGLIPLVNQSNALLGLAVGGLLLGLLLLRSSGRSALGEGPGAWS